MVQILRLQVCEHLKCFKVRMMTLTTYRVQMGGSDWGAQLQAVINYSAGNQTSLVEAAFESS